MADTIDAPQAQVTAMFLADTAMRQVFVIPSLIAGFFWRSRPQPLPLDPEDIESEETKSILRYTAPSETTSASSPSTVNIDSATNMPIIAIKLEKTAHITKA